MMPCSQPGWYCFFVDDEDVNCPFWAEAVEAWGTFLIHFPSENEGEEEGYTTYTLVRAMKVDEETGTLDGSFLEAENFLCVRFSKNLIDTQQSNVVDYSAIARDRDLLEHLEKILYERDHHSTDTDPEDALN